MVSHFNSKKPAEAPQRLADIHGYVLSLACSLSPQSRDRDGLGGQTDRCHGAEPMGAGNNRILTVETEFAATVRSSQSYVFQHFIYAAMQVEIRDGRGIT